MGNQVCECPSNFGNTSSNTNQLTKSLKSQTKEKFRQAELKQDELQEYDNPSRQLLSKKFLDTKIFASNNLLISQNFRSSTCPIVQLNFMPQIQNKKSQSLNQIQRAPSIFVIESENQNKLTNNVLNQEEQSVRKRGVSLDLKLPPVTETKNQASNLQSNTVVQEVSNFIISDDHIYNLMPIKKQSFIRIREEDITQYYQFSGKLGEGSFGNVYRALCLKNLQMRAIKIIKKDTTEQFQIQRLRNQIDILKSIDHPNILKLYQVFIWKKKFYLVTQLCQGGSLFDFLKRENDYSEETIRIICQKILSALNYLHNRNIIHRDLKLENIALKGLGQNLQIKLIDFGLSRILEGRRVRDREQIGTYTHMAPEVLQGVYSSKCDIWSLGIILYILISGTNPFKSITRESTFQKIRHNNLIFKGQQWREVGLSLKQLVSKMLEKNPNQRISAQNALKHPWLTQNMQMKQSRRICKQITEQICNYYRGNNLISVIQSYLSFTKIDSEQLKQITQTFEVIDKNKDGTLEHNEVKKVLESGGWDYNEDELNYLIKKMDKNKSGKIDLNQFISIIANKKKLFARQSLIQAFQYFDDDKSGYLQKAQIRSILYRCDRKEFNKILSNIDKNKDGLISQQQFINYVEAQLCLQNC